MPTGAPRTDLTLRAMTAADLPLLRGLLDRVTGESRWLRFFATVDPDLAARDELRRQEEDGGFGLVAVDGDGEVVGHGMCVPLDPDRAEVAFEVADGHHREGIGTALLREIVARAERRGIRRLVAEVLAVNRDMHDMLRDAGLPLERRSADGVAHYEIGLPGDGAR